MKETAIENLEDLANQVRRDILRMVHGVQSGHPGGSLGCADFLVALYFNVLNHQPKNFSMSGKGEDLFFLSNGHISPVFYSVLSRAGYFEIAELNTFRKISSRLQGHPSTHDNLPGVRMASGSLGQGLSVAIGAAISKKLNKDEGLVYSLHGDGELQEGQIWEAAMYAAHNKVDNLVSVIDYNQKQIDGPTREVLDLGNLEEKWNSFGWETLSMNGNDIQEVLKALDKVKNSLLRKGKPIVIIMSTEMGQGVDFMMHTHKWHGVAPSDEQLAAALKQLETSHNDY